MNEKSRLEVGDLVSHKFTNVLGLVLDIRYTRDHSDRLYRVQWYDGFDYVGYVGNSHWDEELVALL